MTWTLRRQVSSSSRDLGVHTPDALARAAAAAMDHWQPLMTVLAAQITDVVEHTESATMAVMGEVAEADSQADRLVGLSQTLLSCTGAAADQAAVVSHTTADAVSQLVEVLDERDLALNELGRETRALSDHLEVISAIAKTTMILALNAKIEAARAGSAGAGFSVVADEVGLLGKRSAEAVENVRKGIMHVTSLMERGDAEGKSTKATGKDSDVRARLHAISVAQQEMEVALSETNTATRIAAQDVDDAATTLQGRTTAILAEAQFQDITRQSLESVTGALSELGERVTLVATHLRETGDVEGLRELDNSIAALEATYVSQRQRRVHASTVRGHDDTISAELAIELF